MSQDIYVVIEHLRGQVLEISYVMLAAARALVKRTGGQVVAVLLGHDAQGLAKDLNADLVHYLDHPALAEFTPDAYSRAMTPLLKENEPRAVLLGHTSIGMDIASGLSARLGVPIVSQCRNLEALDGKLTFVSQICGGKIMAEGELPGPSVLVTMIPGGYKAEAGQAAKPPEVVESPVSDLGDLRISLREYVEPEAGDVDISKEAFLVSVGRGLQNEGDLEIAQELAQVLGGVVSASRPVVDQGWLPTTRLVGKSGKKVKPKLYLALGISGAPEHVEAITDSQLIVAVNTDPNAPIFDIAKYGAEVDLYDLIPALVKHVQEVKV
jgi:electron transfer flavoprotein alpha subunit